MENGKCEIYKGRLMYERGIRENMEKYTWNNTTTTKNFFFSLS